MSIRLIGPTNAGIRLITSLLEHTCEVSFVHDTVAWSRDHASTLVRHSARHDDGTAPLVLVGSPYTVLGAWWDQRASTAQDDSSGPATMHEFIRSPVILREERPGHASELYYSSPVELWNSLTWNLLQRAEAGNGLVIRIEDAMADPRAARERIAAHYELYSRSPEHATPDAVSRSAADDGGTDRPGENFAGTDESLIRDTAARDLLDRLQYAPTGIDLGDECVPVEYEIFTMAGSSRLEDLTVLLQSNSEFDAAPVNVIPFDDPTSELERICSAYGATIVDPDDSWDALGSALYGEKEFRAGVPAWRYFRKLNALDHTSTPIVFIDANSAITNSLRPALKALREFDVVFGNRSKPGRNFTPWARKVVEHLSRPLGTGSAPRSGPCGPAPWILRSSARSRTTHGSTPCSPEHRNSRCCPWGWRCSAPKSVSS